MPSLANAINRIVLENEKELVKSLINNFPDLHDLEKLQLHTDFSISKLKLIILDILEKKEISGKIENMVFYPK